MKILADNMRRQGFTEGIKQELLLEQANKIREEILKIRSGDIKDFGFDEIMDVLKVFK